MSRLAVLVAAVSTTTCLASQEDADTMQDPRPPSEQAHDHHHSGHDTPESAADGDERTLPHADHPAAMPPAPAAPPPEAISEPEYAADILFDPRSMASARAQLLSEEGATRHSFFLADRFEWAFGDGATAYAWDAQGWYGGDIHKFRFKSEGSGGADDGLESAEIQALYGRAIAPFFDAQFGLRYDIRPNPGRAYVTAGVHGLLPYFFELDAALFISKKGDLSGRLEGEYDLRITQRLILQPKIEVEFAVQDVPEHRLGSGLASVEAGLRLRYEIRREIAPYIGIAWEQKLGDTADIAVQAGESRDSLRAIVGARFWF